MRSWCIENELQILYRLILLLHVHIDFYRLKLNKNQFNLHLHNSSEWTFCTRLSNSIQEMNSIPTRPFLPFFFFHSWCAVRSYQPHFEVRDPIWGDDWSHNLHRLSPSWGSPGFSSAVRQMPGDLCTAPGIISLPRLLLTDVTLGASGLWLDTWTGVPLDVNFHTYKICWHKSVSGERHFTACLFAKCLKLGS